MPIALGNKKVKRMYLGTKEVKKAYLGTKQVYPEQIENGVYILHVNGNLYKREEWDTADNANAVGVAVISDNCQFVIEKKTEIALTWGGNGTIIDNIVTTTINDDAKKDFNGLNNTEEISSQLGSGSTGAAKYCKTVLSQNGKNGYLGSLGEWMEAYNNKSEIDSCISLIGGTAISTARAHWTSTQYNSTAAWFIHWSDGGEDFYSKGSSSLCRPFYPLT